MTTAMLKVEESNGLASVLTPLCGEGRLLQLLLKVKRNMERGSCVHTSDGLLLPVPENKVGKKHI